MLGRIFRVERARRLERMRTKERERRASEQEMALERRLEAVETRQAMAIQGKADQMLRDLEIKHHPLRCVATGVEKGRAALVEEFRLSRPIGEIRGLEFDGEAGIVRVTYKPAGREEGDA